MRKDGTTGVNGDAVGPGARRLERLGVCCPRCHESLALGDRALRCRGCASEYPMVAGIPDLRICPDPYIEPQPDREKAARLAERSPQRRFERAAQTL